MALIQKTNPVAVDKAIDAFQVYLWNKLNGTFADWESYHRVYLNPKNRTSIPEAYIGDGDYKEVLFTDKHELSSFFLVDDEVDFDDGVATVDVSLILQANIEEIYPGIAHRADEELRNDVHFWSEKYPGYERFRLKRIVTGVRNVYREVDFDSVKLDDMSAHHVVRFVYEAKYRANCCNNC